MIYNQFNKAPKKQKVFNQPSLTVPNQALSMREILTRYAQGMPLGGSLVEFYEDPENPNYGINPKTLDLVDIQNMTLEAKQTIQDHETGKAKAIAEKQRKAIEKAKQDAIEAYKAEQEAKQ